MRIRESVVRLTNIIDSTISGEILEGDKIKLKSSEFDLVEMVQQSVFYHEQLYPLRKIFTNKKIESFVYCGDKTLLEQIIINLLANAEKYSTPDRPIAVTIFERDNSFVCSVKDEGVGIPFSEVNKIFSRFYRASNVAHLQGSGLGLSFSRQIAEMHEGNLTILSGEAGNTEFELVLPRVKRHSE